MYHTIFQKKKNKKNKKKRQSRWLSFNFQKSFQLDFDRGEIRGVF